MPLTDGVVERDGDVYSCGVWGQVPDFVEPGEALREAAYRVVLPMRLGIPKHQLIELTNEDRGS
ncbi:MAG: hypothetical protein M5U08_08000 [Burkholderiales bacterium]|nr:hypothetical protein [Burkholderiales bacterium]